MVNATTHNTTIHGWVGSSNDRGSADILWSCCLTIVLCCWVSVYPNTGSPNDKWYHGFLDKINLFCISLLGPEFLFGIAFGQFSNARRTLLLFKNDERLGENFNWTYRYAFYLNMGGLHLTSPDIPQGFPINSEQLHYLIVHKYVDPPDTKMLDAATRNPTDTLSRILTIFQALWFTISEIQRFRKRLPITTLELTTLSFTMVMFATSITWYYKPSCSKPQSISTKDGKTIEAIREKIALTTHPTLPSRWHRTPLEYIGANHYGVNSHWNFYTKRMERMRIYIVSRQIKARPWDRFPSDDWFCPDYNYMPLAGIVLLAFGSMFLIPWNFYFPSYTEKLLWRICAVYHAAFNLYGGLYFLVEMARLINLPAPPHIQRGTPLTAHVADESLVADANKPRRGLFSRRKATVDHEPEESVPLWIVITVSIPGLLYILVRIYFYVEDFLAFRQQQTGVYIGVNRFVPFLG